MSGIHLVLNYPEKGERAVQVMMRTSGHGNLNSVGQINVTSFLTLAKNQLHHPGADDKDRQSMTTKDGQFILVWDGTLYNSYELRNELLHKNLVFESRSDTEVLIQWLREYGAMGIKRLEGVFALFFVDKEKEKITIARDRLGQKSLYYAQVKERWVFSSEVKAIANSELIEKKLDESQYRAYFYSRHSFPNRSFFAGVNQLCAGEVKELDFSGRLTDVHHVKTVATITGLPGINEFREILLDSVLQHFHSNNRVGLSLSGGADSSLLLHTWYRETGIPLPTFTVAFGRYGKKYNDAVHASFLAAKYRCPNHRVLITPEILLENWGAYIGSVDQPIGDSAGFLAWMVAKEAKNRVNALISGTGADELFSGYDRHRAFRLYLKNKRVLEFLANKRRYILPVLPRRARKLLHGIADSDEWTFLNFSALQSIPRELKDEFLLYYPCSGYPYRDALNWDREYYLVNDALKVHDSACMAHGLECRAPYLDSGLVALSNSLSEEQHLSLKPKQWIREILKQDGLGVIARRKNLGFGLPLKEWFEKDAAFRKKVFDKVKSFERDFGLGFPEDMRKLARSPEAYRKEGFLQIWNLFVLVSWKEIQGL